MGSKVTTAIGVAAWALTALWMAVLYLRRPHRKPFPHYGYLGLAVIVIAEILLFRGSETVATWFTPIVWTGYIAVMDAALYSLAGESLVQGRGRELLAAIVISAPFWLVFEGYNLHLRNWVYVGPPMEPALRYFGYAWAFTTIWPAMLLTALFFRAAGLWQSPYKSVRISKNLRRLMVPVGLAMLVIPWLLPYRIAAYLFGLVWLGFIFLLDPLNARIGAPSILNDLQNGERGRLYSLLAAGAVSGIFWEFWNYWAGSKWIYIFPIFQDAKIFEMPLPGFFGFPPFAVEYFCISAFIQTLPARTAGTGPEGTCLN